jgi:BioD-like phosphotransacetylase family protein
LAALYVTSLQVGAGKTAVCVGLARHLAGQGRKVGYFKPMVAAIEEKAAVDSDAEFIKRVLDLKDDVADLCPVIAGKDLSAKLKPAYDKIAEGREVVIVEGVWRLRPGAKPVEPAAEVAVALGAGKKARATIGAAIGRRGGGAGVTPRGQIPVRADGG